MTDLKKLRDKLNGTELMAPDENEKMLIEEWNRAHAELESLKENDERNYAECGK